MNEAPKRAGPPDLPAPLRGRFGCDSKGWACFFDGEWSPSLQHLRVHFGECLSLAKDTEKGTDRLAPPWWTRAAFSWTFDHSFSCGRGKVILGGFEVPSTILDSFLVREGNDWVLKLSWMGAESEAVQRFVLLEDESQTEQV